MDSSNNQSLIRSLTILGSVVIAAFVTLAIWGKDSSILPTTIAPIITIVTLLVSGLLTLKVSSEAKTAAVEARQSSQANANGIEAVHGIVNSQRTAMEVQIKELRERLDLVHSVLAVEQSIKKEPAPSAPVAARGSTQSGTPIVEAPVVVVAPKAPQS